MLIQFIHRNQVVPEHLLKLSDTLHKQNRYITHVHEEVSYQNYLYES